MVLLEQLFEITPRQERVCGAATISPTKLASVSLADNPSSHHTQKMKKDM